MTSSLIGNLFTKLFVLLIGLIFILPSYKLYSYILFRYQSVSVNGIIVMPSRGRDIGARPLVEYHDQQGNTYEIKSKAKTHWLFAPKKGEQIKVLFLRDAPEKAMVDSIFYYVVLPLCFVAIGVTMVFLVFKRSGNALNDASERTFSV
jgi:hypothetical protein